ncbi:MAG: response regulator [Spirochaetaceae bacterium]|nr:MAG: response regulator [Spirochaetaceae bacterium]
MTDQKKTIVILVADDDADDRLLIKEAFEEARLLNPIHFVEDGEDLLDYLKRKKKYSNLVDTPLPGLILLDLNMPRKNGFEALKEIKSDEELKQIPIVVFTTSKIEEDIYSSYNLGVNSFITKPVTFQSLVSVMETLAHYWFEIVELPSSK